MIQIPCRVCGFILEVPQELAGTPVQCPHCHLLSDIPSLSELKQITEDGTYVINPSTKTEDAYRLGEMIYVFSKDKVDHGGNEIDMRGPAAEEDDSYGVVDEPNPELRPKYDPETGELVRPLEIKQDPAKERINPGSIPMAQTALGYANASTTPTISSRSIFINLLRPINLLVMTVIFIFYVCCGALIMLCGSMAYFMGLPFLFIFVLMLMGHWANVVDEIGRQDRDELPRPFRDVQWYEDMCQPLGALMLAFFICYLPLHIVRLAVHDPHLQMLVGLPFALAGTLFFPATFLITSTSGSITNLHPIRLWGTLVAAGGIYPVTVLLWTLAGVSYGFVLWTLLMAATPLWIELPHIYRDWRLLLGALAASIYLMHYFCWSLGMIYRERHAMLPWEFQYHRRDPDRDVVAARRNTRPPKMKVSVMRPKVAEDGPAPAPASAPVRAPQQQQPATDWPEIS